MKRFGLWRQAGVLMLPLALATGAYGLTAANTVPDTDAGDGTVVVSGYTVSDIDYNTNGTNPYNIDSVTFTMEADDGSWEEPRETKLRLDASTTVWYACTASGTPVGATDTYTCDTTAGTQATVADTDEHRVVAVP